MAAYVLTNYMSLGQQTEPDTFVDTTGNTPGVSGAMSMSDAALLSVSGAGLLDPDGENFEIKVVYADQLNPLLQPVFEVMEASYELVGGEYQWVRQRTIASSNNGAAVTFQSGTNNLKIFGVTSHEQFENNRDPRLLDFDIVNATSLTSESTAQSLFDAAAPIVIPKTKPNSSLIVIISGYVRARLTAVAQSYQGEFGIGYVNSSGITVDVRNHLFGQILTPEDDANKGHDSDVTCMYKFSSSQLNDQTSDEWEIVPRIRATSSNTLVSLKEAEIFYIERLS